MNAFWPAFAACTNSGVAFIADALILGKVETLLVTFSSPSSISTLPLISYPFSTA